LPRLPLDHVDDGLRPRLQIPRQSDQSRAFPIKPCNHRPDAVLGQAGSLLDIAGVLGDHLIDPIKLNESAIQRPIKRGDFPAHRHRKPPRCNLGFGGGVGQLIGCIRKPVRLATRPRRLLRRSASKPDHERRHDGADAQSHKKRRFKGQKPFKTQRGVGHGAHADDPKPTRDKRHPSERPTRLNLSPALASAPAETPQGQAFRRCPGFGKIDVVRFSAGHDVLVKNLETREGTRDVNQNLKTMTIQGRIREKAQP
jgi:hypothetical protein